MLKKIGLLTILGLLLLILSGIIYFNSFANTYFPQNGLIGISGILLGFLFIVLDFILIKKKDINNEIHSKLFDFGKIIAVSLFAWFVDIVIFSTSIREYAILLGGVVCITVIIPMVIIGLGIFLTFIRTPLGKSITNKKVNIFCIVLAILLIILPVYLIWPSISPTYMDRQPIQQFHLSSNGTRLLSISGGMPLVPIKKYSLNYVFDYIIWNTTSGNIIWNRTLSNYYSAKTFSYYYDAKISPDGRYFINIENNTIASIESGETVAHFSGTYYDWTENGKYFVTVEDKQIYIWNATNFTKIKTIPINETIRRIALFPDESKLIVEIHKQTQNSLQIIDVLSGNLTYLYNYSGNTGYNIQYLTLSKDENKLQMIKYESISHTSSDYFDNYILIIWNISDKNILYNHTFKNKMDQNELTGAGFGKYIIFDSKKSQLIFYNLTGVETVVNTNQNFLQNFDLSYDESIMAIGSKGIIEVRNATTGLLINTLKTPVYEIERPIPGFEIIIVLGAIASILVFIRLRRKKYRF